MCCVLVIVGHCDLRFIGLSIAAVTAFLALSVHFALCARDRSTLPSRAWSIMLLWCAWSCVYLALPVTRSLMKNEPLDSRLYWWMLAFGPSIHLWYLPALATSRLAIYAAFGFWHRRIGVALCVAIIACLAATEPQILSFASKPPLAQLYVLTVSFFGAVACHGLLPSTLSRAWTRWAWVLFGIGLASSFVMDTMWFGYAITVTATIMLCRVEQAAPSPRLSAFSSCTAGMYLVHILFLFAIHFFTPIGIAWAPVVVILSFATTLLARRTRLRWMFP